MTVTDCGCPMGHVCYTTSCPRRTGLGPYPLPHPMPHPWAAAPIIKGCICPPGAEKTCERDWWDCGRRKQPPSTTTTEASHE